MNAEEIRKQAQEELNAELARESIELEKQKLRFRHEMRKSFWIRFFPWRLKIVRADEPPAGLPYKKIIEDLTKCIQNQNHTIESLRQRCEQYRRSYY
jgi:hypothetical protein